MSPSPRVVVVGAGISGLSAAHRLTELIRQQNSRVKILVLEKASRPGGVISTRTQDGFLWEEGPDSFITEKPWGVDLCRRLGLESDLIGTNPAFQRSFVVWNGHLHATPEGFYLLAPSRFWPMATTSLFSWLGKARMAMELVLPRKRDGQDESLAAFVRRRFGEEALVRMAQPMVAGVYAADPETLSLQATFPRFLQMESDHGSVIKALWKMRRKKSLSNMVSGPRYGLFVTLRGGLEQLVQELIKRLPADAIRYNADVRAVSREGNKWRVMLSAGETVEADAVCLALPAHQTAPLLKETAGPLSDLLDSIPYGSSATVHTVFDRASVRHPLDGFGFVVPTVENRSIIGCTFSHVKFPQRAPAGKVLLRAFVGRDVSAESMDADDRNLSECVLRDLTELLGIQGRPQLITQKKYLRAMPQYTLGHLDRVGHIESRAQQLSGLALAGNGYHGLGIPDCIHSGEQAAERLFENVIARSPSVSV